MSENRENKEKRGNGAAKGAGKATEAGTTGTTGTTGATGATGTTRGIIGTRGSRIAALLCGFIVLVLLCVLSVNGLQKATPENPIKSHSEQIEADTTSKEMVIKGSGYRENGEVDPNKMGKLDQQNDQEEEDEDEEGEDKEQKEEEDSESEPNEDQKKKGGDTGGPKESDEASDREGDGKTAKKTDDPSKASKQAEILTDLKNQTITPKDIKHDEFKFYAYLINNDSDTTLKVKIRNDKTSINGKFISPKRGGKNYAAELTKGYNFITLYEKKNGETIYQITYTINYIENKADKDNPKVGEHPPVITTNLDDRKDNIKTNNFVFRVSAKTYKGKKLSYDHLVVTFDGKTIKTTPTGAGTYEYDLYFDPPSKGDTEKHHVTVRAWDDENNSRFREFWPVYEYANEGDVIGKATINVDATTIGLGMIGSGAKVDIKQGEPASVAVVEAMKEYGFTADYSGTPQSGFYLKGLKGGYIANGAKIPENLKQKIKDDGLNMNGQHSKNSIMEYDYTEGSGWVYTIGGSIHPGRGMSGYYLEDGNVLTLRFTLAYGKDLGGTSTRGVLSSYCGKWMNGSYTANHDMGKMEVTKKATCEESGLKESHCKVKGCKEVKSEEIPALGHDFKETEREEATEEKEGWIIYTCTRCNKTKKETIPKKEKDKPDKPDDPGGPDDPDKPVDPVDPVDPPDPVDPGGGDDGGGDDQNTSASLRVMSPDSAGIHKSGSAGSKSLLCISADSWCCRRMVIKK